MHFWCTAVHWNNESLRVNVEGLTLNAFLVHTAVHWNNESLRFNVEGLTLNAFLVHTAVQWNNETPETHGTFALLPNVNPQPLL